jgi:predicted DNA-binding protein
MKSPKRIVITLEPEQRKALDKISNDTGASIAFLIRRSIDKYLAEVKK